MSSLRSRLYLVAVAAFAAIALISLGWSIARAEGENSGGLVEKKRAEFLAAQVRPPGVEEKDWIPISDRAGYQITRYVSVAVVEATLYLKTDRGWCQAHTLNPVTAQMLGR